jgi:hypothetical protein
MFNSWALAAKKKHKKIVMKALSGQTLIDIAIEHKGSIESVFEVAEANNLSLTDDIEAGYDLFVDQIVDNAIVVDYRAENRKPASDISLVDVNSIIGSGEGIGFMQIGFDFIVS